MLISLNDQLNLEYIVSVFNKNKNGTITVIKGFDSQYRSGRYGLVVLDDNGKALSNIIDGPEEKINFLFECLAWDEEKEEMIINKHENEYEDELQ